jgi:transcription termination factor Rho
MNSNDNFSAKKKKDLVAIAVHFGLLTESKANSMSKQNLVDFFIEQERIGEAQPETNAVLQENPAPKSERFEHEHPAPGAESESLPSDSGEPRISSSTSRRSRGVSRRKSEEEAPDPVSGKSSRSRGRSRSGDGAARDGAASDPTAGVEAGKDVNPEDKSRTEVSVSIGETPVQPQGPEDGTKDPVEQSGLSAEPEMTQADEKNLSGKGADTGGTQRRHSSRGKKRSIIIKPKNNDGLPSDDDYPPENDEQPEDAGSEGEANSEAGASGKGGSARTLRHKEPENEMITGILEIMPEGFGFIRRENYLPSAIDIFIHSNYVRRFGLRTGDQVTGPVRPKKESDKYAPIQYIKEVNGLPPEKMQRRPHFERLTPIYPDERFVLETEKTELSTRIIDLVAPIGKGQRGMIVSPPKAGKTILLQKIANAISTNNPDAKLIVLLIDERPEEVTDMQRSINGEVVYSTFDKKPENHTKIVELVLERAMRLVELENDVVILLDSITRLSRAYNLTINPTGRTLSGGLDPGALYGPKRFFGAARNIENGGSLTIIATSLIDTGSRMDEVIFEEFKGTGNMEVYLDRKLSEKRIFPAIDINKSGTRREELLLGSTELDAVWTIRKAFSQLDTAAVTEMIISLLMKTQSNAQFIQSVNVSFSDKAVFEAMRGTRPACTSTVTNGNSNGK